MIDDVPQAANKVVLKEEPHEKVTTERQEQSYKRCLTMLCSLDAALDECHPVCLEGRRNVQPRRAGERGGVQRNHQGHGGAKGRRRKTHLRYIYTYIRANSYTWHEYIHTERSSVCMHALANMCTRDVYLRSRMYASMFRRTHASTR